MILTASIQLYLDNSSSFVHLDNEVLYDAADYVDLMSACVQLSQPPSTNGGMDYQRLAD